MRTWILIVACLLAACEAPQEPPVSAVTREIAAPVPEKDTISVAPEHFDRVRAEQFEKEEDGLRRRARRD